MATNVLRYRVGDGIHWGVSTGTTVRPIPGKYPTTGAFVREVATAVRDGRVELGPELPLDSVEVVSPITTDQQFLCQAVNYHSHLEESGLTPETSPFNVFFRKASSCLAPPDTDIVCPEGVELLDHEVEIGLVLARDVTQPVAVSDEQLADHVIGLVALNDVSARDVQMGDGQFYRAKSYRTFGPAGPHLTLVDADDLARFGQLRLRLWVDGDLRQDATAAEMVHGPAASLTELSATQDWRAGDLLATGTPGGCALQAPPAPLRMLAQAVSPRRRQALVRRSAIRNGRRLRPGQVVELHVGTDDGGIDLGRQRTPVVAAG